MDNPTDIRVTLDSDTSGLLAMLAQKEQRTPASAAAALIRQALDLHEDLCLSQISNQRLEEDNGARVSHEDAWK